MIKIVASIVLDDNTKKTCSFQTKENRKILHKDLERIRKFVDNALVSGYSPRIYWKITYDQTRTHSMISGMSSKFLVISHDRGNRLISQMIDNINSNLGKGY